MLPGATVQLLAREKNSTVLRIVRSGVTDAEGRVQFRVTPPRTVVLRAHFVGVEGSAPTESGPVVVGVGTRVSVAARALSACRVEVTGRTTPAKPQSRVRLDLGGRSASAVVAADGTYRTVQAVRCGSPVQVTAGIGETLSNEPGRSGLPASPASRPVTCGTGGTDEGPLAEGLTHRLVVFATETAVGGAWYGERVLANPTDHPVSYAYGRGFSREEPYRVLRSGTQQVLGREGTTDSGQGPSTSTLQPGQEQRVPVRLGATNCSTLRAGGLRGLPGPGAAPRPLHRHERAAGGRPPDVDQPAGGPHGPLTGVLDSPATPRAARIPLNSPRAGRQQGQAGSVRVCGGSLTSWGGSA